jgi:hypothetical protein
MEQVVQPSDLALQLLVDTLPKDCDCRKMPLELAAAMAIECLSRESTIRGFDWRKDEVFAAVALKMAIVSGHYKIPLNIHDEICGCAKKAHGHSLEQIIQELKLPTTENPKIENGVCYYAARGGSNKYPDITIWFNRGCVTGKILGSASWDPRQPEAWFPYTNLRGPKYLPKVNNPDQAIRDILADIE